MSAGPPQARIVPKRASAEDRTAPSRARGFTLVEVLVALAILALTSLLAYRATAALADGETRLTGESARWRSLDAALARLEADLREAVPRASRVGDHREPPFVVTVDSDGNSAIVFSRAGPEFSAEPGIAGQRIGYRLADGTLQIAYGAGLDTSSDAQSARYVLVDGIAAMRVDLLRSDGAWAATWPPPTAEAAIPRATRVQLVLSGGESIERWFALR